MRKTTRLEIALWSAVSAAAIYAILAAPGFLSDRDSTVAVRTHEAWR